MIKMCNADKYIKARRQTEPCERPKEFGVLCAVHARQIAGTPDGFETNRVKRVHLSRVTDEEVEESILLFTEAKGWPSPIQHTNPLSYQRQVLEFLGEHGPVRAGDVVAFVQDLSPNSMSAQKVGSLMQVLTRKNLVVRTLTTVRIHAEDGSVRKVGSAYYELA